MQIRGKLEQKLITYDLYSGAVRETSILPTQSLTHNAEGILK